MSFFSELIHEEIGMYFRSLKGKQHKRYVGNAKSICKQIVENCWNGEYFQAGSSNLNQFWIRDFGFCITDLIKMGYIDEVRKTLSWALRLYKKNDQVSTTIFKNGITRDIYTFASDSLPFLLHSLNVTNAYDLMDKYGKFLNSELRRYRKIILDEEKGCAKRNRFFSGVKDTMKYTSTCYTHLFMQWLKIQCASTGGILQDPFPEFDFKEMIVQRYWTGKYFCNDDNSRQLTISADANICCFWTGVFDDPVMRESMLLALEKEGLCSPFPLKYHKNYDWKRAQLWVRLTLPNYQGNSIWTFLAPMYIKQLSVNNHKKAAFYLKKASDHILKSGTLYEVFNPDGRSPLKGRFGYGSESGMLWAALYYGLYEDAGI